MKKIRIFLNSNYSLYAMFFFSLLFKLLNLNLVSIFIFFIFTVATLLLCDNTNIIFSAFLGIQFVSIDLYNKENWFIYGAIIILTLASIIYFLIKHKKKKIKKGELFWVLLLADLAFLLGGIIGFFKIKITLIILGFCLVVYLLYFLAINFTENLFKYLTKTFITISLFLSIIVITEIIKYGIDITWINYININTVALYFVFGIISCLYYFNQNLKHKYLLLLSAIIFYSFLIFLRSRIILIEATLFIFIILLYFFINSKNKKRIIIISSAFLIIIGVLAVVCFYTIEPFKNTLLNIINRTLKVNGQNFLNGRETLWPWCFERFKENLFFGVGFVWDSIPPTLSKNIIAAHNTFLQWITSLGFIGFIMIIPFYFKKYKLLFKSKYKDKFFLIITLLAIAFEGLAGNSAATDIFIFSISIFILPF